MEVPHEEVQISSSDHDYLNCPEEFIAAPPVSEILNDLLDLESKSPAWQDCSVLNSDCVVIIEFSEVEGPRPYYCHPSLESLNSPHFDLDQLALRLMTTDLDSSCKPGNFCLVPDTNVLLSCEEQGLFAYAHHFMLYDLYARGYLRPFCVAYVTAHQPRVMQLFERLRMRFTNALVPMKACNMRRFLKELSQASEALHSMESKAISSYYELYYDQDEQSDTAGNTDVLQFRYQRVQRDLEHSHSVLSSIIRVESPSVCTTVHEAKTEPWLKCLISGVRERFDDIICLKDLAPCAYDIFIEFICEIHSGHKSLDPLLSDVLLNHSFLSTESVLHLGPVPSLFVPSHGSLSPSRKMLQSVIASDNLLEQSGEKSGRDDILLSMVPALPHLLYPLFCGQFLLICGAVLRQSTVEKLVHTLVNLIPSSNAMQKSAGNLPDGVEIWHKNRIPPSAYEEWKLCGQLLSQHEDTESIIASNMQNFIAILNLNSDKFYGVPYDKGILKRIQTKGGKFQTGTALCSYIQSLFSEYCLLTYVLYYYLYRDQDSYRRNVKRLDALVKSLQISSFDMRIVKYLIELMKADLLGFTQTDGFHENLVLHYCKPKMFKL